MFKSCKNFIRTLPTLVHDDRKPEDLDTTGEDHSQDEWRYMLMLIGRPKLIVQKPWMQKELDKLMREDSTYEGIRP